MKKEMFIFSSMLLILFGFYLSSCSYYPEGEKEYNFEINENSRFIQLGNATAAENGIIFYPGGLVDPYAYIEILEDMVLAGNVVIIAKFPSNLAVMNIDAADWILEVFNEVNSWTMIGHSLGGAMACSYVEKNEEKIDKIILLGSYPGNSVDLTDYEGLLLSIYASKDAFTTIENIKNSKSRVNNPLTFPLFGQLEKNSVSYFYEITGGNHSYFGSYGMQKGDNEADIPREKQLNIVKSLIATIINL